MKDLFVIDNHEQLHGIRHVKYREGFVHDYLLLVDSKMLLESIVYPNNIESNDYYIRVILNFTRPVRGANRCTLG